MEDDNKRDDSMDSDLKFESHFDHNGTWKTHHIDIEANDESLKSSNVKNSGSTKGAHFQFYERCDVGHQTDEDLKAMIRTLVNLPAGTNITMQHSLRFICLQMSQIKNLKRN